MQRPWGRILGRVKELWGPKCGGLYTGMSWGVSGDKRVTGTGRERLSALPGASDRALTPVTPHSTCGLCALALQEGQHKRHVGP